MFYTLVIIYHLVIFACMIIGGLVVIGKINQRSSEFWQNEIKKLKKQKSKMKNSFDKKF